MAFVDGIDVSRWQGQMDWAQAKSAGAQFAFIRASSQPASGTPYEDIQFQRNAAEAPQHLPIGFYHYFRPLSNPEQQADFFSGRIIDKEFALPPVADVESRDGMSAARIQGRLLTFLQILEQNTGKKPIIYTRGSFWNPYIGNPSWASSHDVWVARYSETLQHPWGDGYYRPYPWQDYKFWQWSADGNYRGAEFGAQSYHIDLNRFNGTLEQFNDYIGEVVVEPPPPIQTPTVKVNTYALYVRNGPGTGYTAIRVVYSGDLLQVYDVHRNWVRINPIAQEWCHSAYVDSLQR